MEPIEGVAGERAGDRIDRYTLLEELGEGGMGTVWLAEQTEPVRREVALKIIKLGMDTREVVARFEAERQALALMDHPHIAKVLDGGATDGGRPYFVMELVRGTPITDHCHGAGLGLEQRLSLFSQVCEAVQHAHQKGIIHRDLKPSNVLVAEVEGQPSPKVIDFGIAKATGAELSQETFLTQEAQILGTPEYMAPEQASMGAVDVDTRADVYSLGVLLYELLTGSKPFDVRKALEAGFDELLRTIREIDPAKPSTRVASQGAGDGDTTLGGTTTSRDLTRDLRGDLDWIVMKAIEKDRGRRYESAAGLAEDVGRYLGQEPVLAAPPSLSYRVRKLVRRRRKTVVAVGLIALLFVGGAVGTSLGWWKARVANAKLGEALEEKSEALVARGEALEREKDERRRAERNERRALDAEEVAEAEAERARREAERASQSTLMLFDALGSVAPDVALGKDTALMQAVFDRLAAKLEAGAVTDPWTASNLHGFIGGVYVHLGRYEEAIRQLDLSMELRPTDTVGDALANLSSRKTVGDALQALGRLGEAEEAYRATLDSYEAQGLPRDRMAVSAQVTLALVLIALERLGEAEPLLLEAREFAEREFGEEDEVTLAILGNTAKLYSSQGRIPEALELAERELELRQRIQPPTHPDMLSTRGNLANLLRRVGREEDSIDELRLLVELRREIQGEDHLDVFLARIGLAESLLFAGRTAEAETEYEELFFRGGRLFGEDSTVALSGRGGLARVRDVQNRLDEAEDLYRGLLDAQRRKLGRPYGIWLQDLGNLLGRQGRVAEAEPFSAEALEVYLDVEPDNLSGIAATASNLAYFHIELGRFEDAVRTTDVMIRAREGLHGSDSELVWGGRQSLVRSFNALGDDAEAVARVRPIFEAQLEALESPAAPPMLLNAVGWALLTHPVEGVRDPSRARSFAERAAVIAEETASKNLWRDLHLLAQAQFETGDLEAAVASQGRALESAPREAKQLMGESLAAFEAARDDDL